MQKLQKLQEVAEQQNSLVAQGLAQEAAKLATVCEEGGGVVWPTVLVHLCEVGQAREALGAEAVARLRGHPLGGGRWSQQPLVQRRIAALTDDVRSPALCHCTVAMQTALEALALRTFQVASPKRRRCRGKKRPYSGACGEAGPAATGKALRVQASGKASGRSLAEPEGGLGPKRALPAAAGPERGPSRKRRRDGRKRSSATKGNVLCPVCEKEARTSTRSFSSQIVTKTGFLLQVRCCCSVGRIRMWTAIVVRQKMNRLLNWRKGKSAERQKMTKLQERSADVQKIPEMPLRSEKRSNTETAENYRNEKKGRHE